MPEAKDAKTFSIVMPAENPTYFYHSFPRQKDYVLGLKILNSILEKGLLLTAELRTFAACEGLDAGTFIQQRVCFTALTTDRLAHHAETFGSFSLEFDGPIIRNFGALPAVYFSGRLEDGELFNGAGEMLARHLLEAHDDLKRLWKLHDEGTEGEVKLAKAVLGKIHTAKITVQELHFTLQALLNLYYPTDDAKWTGPLHYYHQHEWKIIPNLTFDRTWHYHPLTSEQRSDLLQINPAFFGTVIQGKLRVDYCSCFLDVGGKNVGAFLNQ